MYRKQRTLSLGKGINPTFATLAHANLSTLLYVILVAHRVRAVSICASDTGLPIVQSKEI